jgi:hypothetical protein
MPSVIRYPGTRQGASALQLDYLVDDTPGCVDVLSDS